MTYYHAAEIENIVRSFESCATGRDDFKHRDHLAVAIWYVHTLGKEAALDAMRSSLLRFLDHHRVDRKKYSEAITVFWIERVAEKSKELGAEVTLVDKCNKIVESPDFRPQIYMDEHGSDF